MTSGLPSTSRLLSVVARHSEHPIQSTQSSAKEDVRASVQQQILHALAFKFCRLRLKFEASRVMPDPAQVGLGLRSLLGLGLEQQVQTGLTQGVALRQRYFEARDGALNCYMIQLRPESRSRRVFEADLTLFGPEVLSVAPAFVRALQTGRIQKTPINLVNCSELAIRSGRIVSRSIEMNRFGPILGIDGFEGFQGVDLNAAIFLVSDRTHSFNSLEIPVGLVLDENWSTHSEGFDKLVKLILRRIRKLGMQFSENQSIIDSAEFIEKRRALIRGAKELTCELDLHSTRTSRYSARQRQRHSVEAVAGSIGLECVTEQWRSLLVAAQFVGLGKKTAMGFGGVRLAQ